MAATVNSDGALVVQLDFLISGAELRRLRRL